MSQKPLSTPPPPFMKQAGEAASKGSLARGEASARGTERDMCRLTCMYLRSAV